MCVKQSGRWLERQFCERQLNWIVMVGSFSFLLMGDPPALSEIEGELFRILEGS